MFSLRCGILTNKNKYLGLWLLEVGVRREIEGRWTKRTNCHYTVTESLGRSVLHEDCSSHCCVGHRKVVSRVNSKCFHKK